MPEAQRLAETNEPATLAALQLARRGTVYDLDCSRWPGMPLGPGHPPFQLLNYRSPRGVRNQQDQGWLAPNTVNFGWHSEYVMGTVHTGTHIDAHSHITCAEDDHFPGGSSHDALGDFGLLKGDSTEIPPIITRGVLIDVPAAKGVPALGASEPISDAGLREALALQELRSAEETRSSSARATSRDGPTRLRSRARQTRESISQQGSSCSSLARPMLAATPRSSSACRRESRGTRFQFISNWLPLKIKGATGSMVRPIAVL